MPCARDARRATGSTASSVSSTLSCGRRLVITAYPGAEKATMQHPLLEQNLRIGQMPFIQARILARDLRGDFKRESSSHSAFPSFRNPVSKRPDGKRSFERGGRSSALTASGGGSIFLTTSCCVCGSLYPLAAPSPPGRVMAMGSRALVSSSSGRIFHSRQISRTVLPVLALSLAISAALS